MLAKKFRLPLQSVPRGPLTLRTPLFAVRVLPPRKPYARWGVVAGTAVDKRATARNRLRRLAFEVCGTLSLTQPRDVKSRGDHVAIRDVVIIIQHPAAALTSDQFRRELRQTLDAALGTKNQPLATSH